jgi:hypothetical protein
MRRTWGLCVGAGIGLASTATAQTPAARFGVVQALSTEEARPAMLVRGQAPGIPPVTTPMGTSPMNPMGATPQPGSVPLGPPKLFGNGPSVLEQRTNLPPAQSPTFGAAPPTYYPQSNLHAAAPYAGAVYAPPPGYAHPGGVYSQPPAYAVPGAGADGGMFPTGVGLETPLYSDGLVGTAATSATLKWYIGGEYLLWWVRSATVPALITTSSPVNEGILGRGDTRILFGNGSFGNNLHGGGRFTVGHWFGCEQRWGIEGQVFFLGRNGQEFRVNTSQFPTLARPFFDVNANEQSAETVASPLRGAIGGAAVKFDSSLWGADVNLRRFLTKTNCARLDLLGGFKYISLEEELSIDENYERVTDVGNANVFPIRGTVNDTFRTTNRFYGAQVGLTGEVRRGRFFMNGTGKVGFGTVFQTASISGMQQATLADGTQQQIAGGLYALPGANIGTFKRDKFAVAPEIGVNFGYHLTPHVRVFVGYNFFYLSNVLRPGDQIDQGLDVTRIPFFNTPGGSRLPTVTNASRLSQVRPAPLLKDSDFFAQGVNFGLQFNW